MSREKARLLRSKKGCSTGRSEGVITGAVNIQESPMNNRQPITAGLDSKLEESILAGDRSSVLFTLEKAVEILRSQIEQEEQQLVDSTRRKPLLPVWFTNHILLITFFIQVAGIGVLEIFNAVEKYEDMNVTTKDDVVFYTGGGIICVIEAAHLLLVILASFKLVKQVLHHTASGGFLAQCYLSTVLLFAGIYTLEFRFNNDAWEKVHAGAEAHPIFVYLRMVYFSVSTATLCGTSTVEPLKWYSFLTVAAQMLLSFVYFTSILSMAIIPKKPSKYGPIKQRKEKSFTNCFRRCMVCCSDGEKESYEL